MKMTTGGKPRKQMTKDEQIANLKETASILAQENVKLREQVENLNIPVVSQERDLLIDFCEVYAKGQFEDPDDAEGIVDWYMKVKDN